MYNKSLILVVVLFLSGCGFQPLYAPKDKDVVGELASIKVARIDDREGQILRNHLLHALNPYGPPSLPLYHLKVTLTSSRGNLGFRKDATPRRARIQVVAKVALTDAQSGITLYSDTIDTMTGFAVGPRAEVSSFPEIVSEDDSKKRLLELIAEEIRVHLSAYFVGKKG